MARLGRIFITGMFISFLGSLPLGTLNIAAMQISITDGLRPAFYFVFGCLITELVYVRLSLIAMDWIQQPATAFQNTGMGYAGHYFSACDFFFLCGALHPSVSKNVILSSTLHRFWLGLFMSALNPVQIPFWFGWSTVLLTKKIFQPQTIALQYLYFRHWSTVPCWAILFSSLAVNSSLQRSITTSPF